MLPSAARKEVFEGNPVEPGNCPATVKGTKADMPLSFFDRMGRPATRMARQRAGRPESGYPGYPGTKPFEGRGGLS